MDKIIGTWRLVNSEGDIEVFCACTSLPVPIGKKAYENKVTRSKVRMRIAKSGLGYNYRRTLGPTSTTVQFNFTESETFKTFGGDIAEVTYKEKDGVLVEERYTSQGLINIQMSPTGMNRMNRVMKYKDFILTEIWEKC